MEIPEIHIPDVHIPYTYVPDYGHSNVQVIGCTYYHRDTKNTGNRNLIIEDPNGKDDLLVDADELHVLKDRPVKFELRTIDVLHNFYVPQFRGKMDMVPGIITYYWLTPTRVGDFEVLCAEYCGTGHYAMRGRVIVDEEKDYKKWEAKQITFEKMLAKSKKNDNLQLVKKEK